MVYGMRDRQKSMILHHRLFIEKYIANLNGDIIIMNDENNKKNLYSARKFVILAEGKDNVAVALEDLVAGTEIEVAGKKIRISENIPFRMKFSICDIKKGEPIIKDGTSIGYALEDIKVGQVVHVHNLASERSREWKQ